MAPVTEDTIGYWGPPTSTLDWCETNYEVSVIDFSITPLLPPIEIRYRRNVVLYVQTYVVHILP